METNLKITISKEDAALKELLESLAKLQSLFGGAIPSAVKKAGESVASMVSKGEGVARESVSKIVETVKSGNSKIIEASKTANEIRAQAEKEYTDLKHEYVLKGLDATRQAIHEEEQSVKASRDAIQKAVREGASKETQAVLKGERDKQNARLQGLRSVEKEITGARTFTEQLEKNVYEPLQEKEKKGGALTAILFGEAGTLKKNAEAAESEAKDVGAKIESFAKESEAKITSITRLGAVKLKEIDVQLATAKSEEEKKELTATKESVAAQIEQEVHLTKEKQTQEGLQLQHHKATLEKEAADSKAEAEQKKSGGGGMGLVGGLVGGASIMGAVSAFKMLDEKAKEANNAQIQLQQGSGLAGEALKKQGEEAEKLGDKYGITGDAAKGMEGTLSSMTHATGAELNKQTEAIIAYASTHKRANQTVEQAASRVMKQYATNALLRAQIDSHSALNQKKAMAAMNTPAMQEKKAMAEVTTAIGQLASMVMNALGPVLTAASPIIKTITSTLGAVLKPILHALTPIIADVSGAIADMLPPVMELVKAVLGLLEPVLIPLKAVFHAILPIFETVVKQVSTALAPVFKALTPILSEVAGLIGDLASMQIKTMFIPILNILLPILTQLLVPVLMSLMPLLKMIADLLSTVLTPTLKIFGDIMNWIVTNAIQPLVKWLTGALLDGVNQVVGVITKAVGAITHVVGAITSFLGLGDKAAAATTDAGKKVLDAQKDANQKSIDQTKSMSLAEEAELKQRISSHTATIAEIKAAELKAEQSGNQTFADYLKHYESSASDAPKKAKGGGRAKIAKDAEQAEKNAAENQLNIQKDNIIITNETDKQAKKDSLNDEIEYATSLLAIEKHYHGEKSKQYLDAEARLLTLKRQQQSIAAAELKAAGKAKELAKKKEDAEVQRQRTETLNIQTETDKLGEANEKKSLAARIALLKSHGEDVSALEKQQEKIEEADENKAYASDLAKRKLQMAKKMGLKESELNSNRTWNNLEQQLRIQHELKIQAIQKQSLDAQKKQWEQNNAYLLGPVTKGFAQAGNVIDQKFFQPLIKNTLGTKTFFGQMVSEVVSNLIKMGVQFGTQQALMLAESLVFHASSTAAATAAGAATAAAYAPAATLASVMSFGAADLAGTAGLTGALAAGNALAQIKLAAGGDPFTTAGPYIVGERGPELVNMPAGANVIPNHRIAAASQSDFGGHADRIIAAINHSSGTIAHAASRSVGILPMNNSFETQRNNYLKAEARRSA